MRTDHVPVQNALLSDGVEVHLRITGSGNGVLQEVPVAALDTDEHADDDEEEGGEEAHKQRPGEGHSVEERRCAHHWPVIGAVDDQSGQDA